MSFKHIMKDVLTFLLLILVPMSSWGTDRINWIRKEYSEIRSNLDFYEKKSIDYFGESSEGAEAVAHVGKNGEVKLIEVTYYGEMGKSSFEFYYSNDQVFFVLEQSYAYNTHIMMTEERAKEWAEVDGVMPEIFDPEKTQLEEWRYYFEGEKAVRVLGPKKNEVEDYERVKTALKISKEQLFQLR